MVHGTPRVEWKWGVIGLRDWARQCQNLVEFIIFNSTFTNPLNSSPFSMFLAVGFGHGEWGRLLGSMSALSRLDGGASGGLKP